MQHLMTFFALDVAVARVIFIGLASLTIPHFVLELAHDRWVLDPANGHKMNTTKTRDENFGRVQQQAMSAKRFWQINDGSKQSMNDGQAPIADPIGKGWPVMETLK